MIIDFKNIPLQEHANFKDGRGKYLSHMFSDEKSKIMLGCLPSGSSIGFHTHTEDCEVIVCISGEGNFIMEEHNEKLLPGDVHYCPKGQSHSLENNGSEDLKFYAIVTK